MILVQISKNLIESESNMKTVMLGSAQNQPGNQQLPVSAVELKRACLSSQDCFVFQILGCMTRSCSPFSTLDFSTSAAASAEERFPGKTEKVGGETVLTELLSEVQLPLHLLLRGAASGCVRYELGLQLSAFFFLTFV